jgi:RNA polymerase sigma factor (sigma-70 family)
MSAMGWDAEPDAALVKAAAAGSSEAWDALVERFVSRVWAIARAHRLSPADAEDVCQVTWLQLVTHLDTIREPERVGAWLATTARHECLRVLRRSGRQVPVGDADQLEPEGAESPAVDTGMLTAERDALLWQALSALSPQCQRLLRALMADPEPSYQEVSSALDMPIGSIGPTRARCLNHLRRRMAGIMAD